MRGIPSTVLVTEHERQVDGLSLTDLAFDFIVEQQGLEVN